MTRPEIDKALEMAKRFAKTKDAPVAKYQAFLDDLRAHVKNAGGNDDDVEVVAALYFALGVCDGCSPFVAQQRVARAGDIARVVCQMTAAQLSPARYHTIH